MVPSVTEDKVRIIRYPHIFHTCVLNVFMTLWYVTWSSVSWSFMVEINPDRNTPISSMDIIPVLRRMSSWIRVRSAYIELNRMNPAPVDMKLEIMSDRTRVRITKIPKNPTLSRFSMYFSSVLLIGLLMFYTFLYSLFNYLLIGLALIKSMKTASIFVYMSLH